LEQQRAKQRHKIAIGAGSAVGVIGLGALGVVLGRRQRRVVAG
jgi:hypothetical protein